MGKERAILMIRAEIVWPLRPLAKNEVETEKKGLSVEKVIELFTMLQL